MTSASAASAALPDTLAAEARAWIAADPDPQTRSELTALLEAGDLATLADRFAEPLTFGTVGLRAPLGAGPARMNRLVVRRTTAGLARWLLAKGEQAARCGIVVGRDARHGSAAFAADVVEVAAAMGVRVRVLPQPLPTPLTAFAVLHYGAAAGVMVTASHNPAPDNGYKVYAADGAQIVPPDDGLIAASAAAGRPPPTGAPPAAPDLVVAVDRQELLGAYADAVLAVLDAGAARQLRVVYTPVHGVGGEVLPWLMARAGFAPPALVSEQARPDPDFPTAEFPNPEEPGVLDLALAEAARLGADLVIANDPDADRLAVAVPDPGTTSAWRVLSGDELGVLLGEHLIRRGGRFGTPVVATSIVSSELLGFIARAAGVRFAQTLTGFKWIARAVDAVPDGHLLFGYEEALGYAVSTAVRDKDGLSAALLVMSIAAAQRALGRRLTDSLDELDERFGVHRTSQWSLRLGGPQAQSRLLAVVDRWRSRPPQALAGMRVDSFVDLGKGLAGLPATAGVLLRLRRGAASDASAELRGRVVVRPSGTEPKLKAYLELAAPAGRAVVPARREVGEAMEELRAGVAAELDT